MKEVYDNNDIIEMWKEIRSVERRVFYGVPTIECCDDFYRPEDQRILLDDTLDDTRDITRKLIEYYGREGDNVVIITNMMDDDDAERTEPMVIKEYDVVEDILLPILDVDEYNKRCSEFVYEGIGECYPVECEKCIDVIIRELEQHK